MGIRFSGATEKKALEYGARTFIEINRNHTRIEQRHLYLIAYDVLNETSGTAIAAKVVLNCNAQQGPGQGLFKTNRTTTGRLPVVTIIEVLGRLLEIERIGKNGNPVEATGYELLLGEPICELVRPERLVAAATGAFKRYLNLLRKCFKHDWPGDNDSESGLRRAKFFSAFIRLFDTMVSEGKDWAELEGELLTIRANVMGAAEVGSYNTALFREDTPGIPTWKDKITDIHDFLVHNRTEAWARPVNGQ